METLVKAEQCRHRDAPAPASQPALMSIEPVDSGMITEDYSTRLKIKPAVVGLEVKAESIELGLRESSGVKDEEATLARRARRLRRKRLAEDVVARWKHFAWEGIAEARAHTFAASAPRRRALARWRAAISTSRASHLRMAAAGARRRFIVESHGLARWVAVTHEARRRRQSRIMAAAKVASSAASVSATAVGGTSLLTRAVHARASRTMGRWQEAVAARRGRRESLSIATTHTARRLAASALCRWKGFAVVAGAKRGLHALVLRTWASGMYRRGLAALRFHAAARRSAANLRERASRGRRRLLSSRGLRGLEGALLRAAEERDIVGEMAARRARMALSRWRWWITTARAKRAARNEQARLYDSRLSLGRARRAVARWRCFCSTRRHFRHLHDQIATVPSPSFSPPPPPPPLSPIPSTAKTSTAAPDGTAAASHGATRLYSSPPAPPFPAGRKALMVRTRLQQLETPSSDTVSGSRARNCRALDVAAASVGNGLPRPSISARTRKSVVRDGGREGSPAVLASPPYPLATATVTTTAVTAGGIAGRARAVASVRRWRRGLSEKRERKVAAGLAESFRDHVLLLRHHESWKAFARRGREAAVLAAAATALGRRARMRRVLQGMVRGVEVSAEERRQALPVFREAFRAWEAFCAARTKKKERRLEEEKAREKRTSRRALQAWARETRLEIVGRQRQEVGDRARRRRSLRGALRAWKRATVELRRGRENVEASHEHLRRRRLSDGLGAWRTVAARKALRRAASSAARDRASKNLALRTLAAWRATADLQAARRAVFHARVSTAAGVLAGGKLRRALDRWREFHDSSRVTLITRLRAEGHAQRKILGKFWRAWVAARDVQRRRKEFEARLRAFRRKSLQGRAFQAITEVVVAAREQREKVRAALLLWKLHTQAKAFAALAAHRLRRRWKKDRARRASVWRRERLVQEGALRWAATADALAASRISSAAFREGNAAARRWKAAGRCARHWRRVAAARAMQRRVREGDIRGRCGLTGTDSGTGSAAAGGVVNTLSMMRGTGAFGGRTRPSAATAAMVDPLLLVRGTGTFGGKTRPSAATADEEDRCFWIRWPDDGKENEAHTINVNAVRPRPSYAAVAPPAVASATEVSPDPPLLASLSGASAPAILVEDLFGRNDDDNSSAATRRPLGNPELAERLMRRLPRSCAIGDSWSLEDVAADAAVPAPASVSAPLPTFRRRSHPGDVGNGPPESGVGARGSVIGDGSGNGEARVPEQARIDRRGYSTAATKATTLTSTAVDFSRARAHPSSPPLSSYTTTTTRISGAPCVSRRRPTPRRPLELLLDETTRGQLTGRGAATAAMTPAGYGRGAVGSTSTGFPTWVVDEMNRLYGARSSTALVSAVPTAAAGGDGQDMSSACGTGLETGAMTAETRMPVRARETLPYLRGSRWRDCARDGIIAQKFPIERIFPPERESRIGGLEGAAGVVVGSRVGGALSGGGGAGIRTNLQRSGGPARADDHGPAAAGVALLLPSDIGDAHGRVECDPESVRPRSNMTNNIGVRRSCASRRQQSGPFTPGDVGGAAEPPREAGVDNPLRESFPPRRMEPTNAHRCRDDEPAAVDRVSSDGEPAAFTIVSGGGDDTRSTMNPDADFSNAFPRPAPAFTLAPESGKSIRGDDTVAVRDHFPLRREGVAPSSGGRGKAVRIHVCKEGEGMDADGDRVRSGSGWGYGKKDVGGTRGGDAAGELPMGESRSCFKEERTSRSSQRSSTENLGVSEEESVLEARVAEAERHLRELQEKAKRRRRDKRELAALHGALARQESPGSRSASALSRKSPRREGFLPCFSGELGSASRGDLSDDEESSPTFHEGDGAAPAGSSSGAALPVAAGAAASCVGDRGEESGRETTVNADHDEVPTDSSRTQLLVRMGLLRARLEENRGFGASEGGSLRPVAEGLRREVEELTKSGGVGATRMESL